MSIIFWEFPGGPVGKDSTLPLQGAFVPSLVGELEPYKPRNYTHTHTHTHTHRESYIYHVILGNRKNMHYGN